MCGIGSLKYYYTYSEHFEVGKELLDLRRSVKLRMSITVKCCRTSLSENILILYFIPSTCSELCLQCVDQILTQVLTLLTGLG